MGLKLITGPTAEPVTLTEAKSRLRIEASGDDADITSMIVTARRAAEHLLGSSLMPQTWEASFDGFECEMKLQRSPVASVTSVKYLDTAGTLQTLDSSQYELNDYKTPPEIIKPYVVTWPATQSHENAVRIRYVAGYADAASVPQEIKDWILLRVGMLYENRESVAAGVQVSEVPYVDSLLDGGKVWG